MTKGWFSMKTINITGRNIVVTEAIKSYCDTKFSRLTKYFDNILEICATLSAVKSKKGPLQTAEVRVIVNGSTIKGVAIEEDLYVAIDKVTDILEKQLIKHKEKLRDNHHVNNDKKILFKSDDNFITVETTKKIVNVSLNPRPMDVEEAILQLETLNKDFYVFTNSESGNMNVVYKKRNGDYGHIEPEEF